MCNKAFLLQQHLLKAALDGAVLKAGAAGAIQDNALADLSNHYLTVRQTRQRLSRRYDSKTLEDVSRIAEAITASGYPASVQGIVSPEALRKERDLVAAKSEYYIASVGGWDIARSDFSTELEIAKKRYSKLYGDTIFASTQGETLLDNLRAQIVSRLIDEGIFMQEINKSRYKVDAQTVDGELRAFLQKHGKSLPGFKASTISWCFFCFLREGRMIRT